MTDKQNFEKDINVPSKRPPYEIALMHDHILRLEEELKAKEQECEELKEAFDGLFKVQYQLADSYKKLRQCLTEIKEITEKTLNMVDYKTYFKRDNKSLKQEGFKAKAQILQIISEVE